MPDVAAVAVEAAAAARRRRLSRRFYVCVGVALLIVNIVAFAPPLTIDTSQRMGSMTPVVAVHGLTSLLFLLVFVAQATLVATGRTSIHRRLGFVGGLLAAVIVVLGVQLSIEQVRRGHDLSGDLLRLQTVGANPVPERMVPGPTMMTNLNLFASFGILVAVALLYRKRPAIHKRLMLLALLGVLTNPPIAHLMGHYEAVRAVAPIAVIPLTLILLSVSALHDKVTDGHIHPVSILAPSLLLVWILVWNGVIVTSSAGERLAMWLIR